MKRPFELVAEIQEKNAEIAAMAKLAVLLKADIERLKALCARAAEALEADQMPWGDYDKLIAELRKATQ